MKNTQFLSFIHQNGEVKICTHLSCIEKSSGHDNSCSVSLIEPAGLCSGFHFETPSP